MITGNERPHIPQTFRLLLAVADIAEAEMLWPLAKAIVSDREGQLIVMHVVAIPEGESLSEGTLQARQSRDALNQMIQKNGEQSVCTKTIVRVGHEIWTDIWETVGEEGIDVLLVGWRSETMPQMSITRSVNLCLANPPCDVIVARLGEEVSGKGRWRKVRRILLPVRGDPGNSLLLRTVIALAEAADATITILHATDHVVHHSEQDWSAPITYTSDGRPRLARSVVSTGSASEAILEEARNCQIVVMGTTRWPMDPGDWGGPIVNAVASDLRCSLITIKERTRLPSPVVLKEISRREEKSSLSVAVDKWFAENTFHSQEFDNLERLVALKEEQGVTISLGLPALNEEKTVGRIIKTVKKALMDRIPLLDEIVLIDSNSRDRTREIAAGLGIPVYIHQDILPQHGARQGKGEALWKSLHVLKGDIIAWIDTDIVNADPRFVYGIIGPLLQDPRIQYVKGFYHRPIWENGKLRPGGGGRVTELACRPLLNLFFAELSGLVQPLSGEYAGRRSVLEEIPFFCGYGVETGLLIDILERYGMGAIAQVDLLERVHRNQSLLSLSKMSFAVLQVIMRRLEDRHDVHLMEEVNKTMKLVHYWDHGYSLEEEEIRELERPPIIRIPEYQSGRGLDLAEHEERATA